MGRVAVVEFNDVAIIANEIKAAGGRPSARAVLAALGVGSMSTVQKHFKQWEADQARHLPENNLEILSLDIARAINLTIFAKVQEATAILSNMLEEEKAICAQMQKEYDQLSADHEIQLTALSDMETKYAELTGRAEQLESDFARTAIELSNERKTSESARTDLAIANHQLERLHLLEAEVEMLRSELKLANDNAAGFSKAAAVAEAKLEAALAPRN